jgi:hypothetical protein
MAADEPDSFTLNRTVDDRCVGCTAVLFLQIEGLSQKVLTTRHPHGDWSRAALVAPGSDGVASGDETVER